MGAEFWLNEAQWAAIAPHLPTGRPGPRRKDDRRIISGIIHVLRVGCRWQDCPRSYGPPTTIYNRFHRWSEQGVWQGLFGALAQVGIGDVQAIDSTTAKAHRCAAGGKGGLRRKPSAARGADAAPKSTRSSMGKAAPSPCT